MATLPERRLDLRAPSTALVVVRAQLGDRAALDEVLAALQEPLVAHIVAILGEHDAALDVLQDVLLTIARKLGDLRDPRWLRAWAFRIATRQALRHARRASHRLEQPADEDLLAAVPAPTPEPVFEPELVATVGVLVAGLPPASGIVVRLRYLEGLSVPEIAEALEIAEGTVKSRLAYGLSRLRALAVALPR
jgi:RNA polymerase sigma factor (sigma-70 family)